MFETVPALTGVLAPVIDSLYGEHNPPWRSCRQNKPHFPLRSFSFEGDILILEKTQPNLALYRRILSSEEVGRTQVFMSLGRPILFLLPSNFSKNSPLPYSNSVNILVEDSLCPGVEWWKST